MSTPQYHLVSHVLCPYVQRAVIVLTEKGVPFERTDVDLGNKPDWFRRISPLGKTPVLVVDGAPIFESAVICDYLDETLAPRLHPDAPLERARHRAWVEFASALLNTVWGFYTAADETALAAATRDIRARFEQLEDTLGTGPYFGGAHFSIVDAAFGPVFRYFDVFERIDDFGFFAGLPKVTAWRQRLAERPSVRAAVRADYPQRLMEFLLKRGSMLSTRIRDHVLRIQD
ncbi:MULTISPECIES: glutathione S-transferase family protein [unclassified Burkholderia]|uniref:glutathione S-transferase family protein n=1 Tax=unclassified Burkholderia TaxID=2613784 RepID=UPI000F5A14C9|nr:MULTISPECIES: glutathione S-transferase family protein [unclassified Burkholderia]RQR28920.1 glutathione S-transferase family protein [Burkholderia sp. Bp9131]RQR60555.1 glutathione S-transferase family protein [Burkholderia sp. Bp9015]RQR93504.1 glutathione S-transferase family protein [Burkholderia sp. Bp8991]RQS17475.1 glutathione S-transferase family protein [Burkholderia sp. Bp8995]RQS37870.1 glutathione S-transferase family protein [Burkholderia sp. Bp8989]